MCVCHLDVLLALELRKGEGASIQGETWRLIPKSSMHCPAIRKLKNTIVINNIFSKWEGFGILLKLWRLE
jgi:hypothetical protein